MGRVPVTTFRTVVESPQEKHHGIKCLTCGIMLSHKFECRKHRGHEVVYVDEKGEAIIE